MKKQPQFSASVAHIFQFFLFAKSIIVLFSLSTFLLTSILLNVSASSKQSPNFLKQLFGERYLQHFAIISEAGQYVIESFLVFIRFFMR